MRDKYDFADWELHDAPADECGECGERRGYEAGSSNIATPCWNCGDGKPEEDEDSQET
tara:strand:- start:837 stop:1010 length:174 start_codon:yes stop_codon:yes gene_type:complete